MSDKEPWWGDFPLAEQQSMSWSIGERKLVIQRQASEWNTWNVETETENADTLMRDVYANHLIPDQALLGRHLQAATAASLRVIPALADRSIVTRPKIPLRLLGGEQTRIYVSTPLWFKALTLPGDLCLLDVPFWRPSDSWFGPSTREGEMCYAKYTEARLHTELLVQRPHRAITPILIHNKQQEALLIERLNVPVPLLSLYQDTQHRLWTNTIKVTREADDDLTELLLEKQAPAEADGANLVAGPRIITDRHRLIRSLGSLFA
jgi:hypothetical protein